MIKQQNQTHKYFNLRKHLFFFFFNIIFWTMNFQRFYPQKHERVEDHTMQKIKKKKKKEKKKERKKERMEDWHLLNVKFHLSNQRSAVNAHLSTKSLCTIAPVTSIMQVDVFAFLVLCSKRNYLSTKKGNCLILDSKYA